MERVCGESIPELRNPGSGSSRQQHKEEFFPLWPHAAFPPQGFRAIWIPFQLMPPKIHNLATLWSVNESIMPSCIPICARLLSLPLQGGSWDSQRRQQDLVGIIDPWVLHWFSSSPLKELREQRSRVAGGQLFHLPLGIKERTRPVAHGLCRKPFAFVQPGHEWIKVGFSFQM